MSKFSSEISGVLTARVITLPMIGHYDMMGKLSPNRYSKGAISCDRQDSNELEIHTIYTNTNLCRSTSAEFHESVSWFWHNWYLLFLGQAPDHLKFWSKRNKIMCLIRKMQSRCLQWKHSFIQMTPELWCDILVKRPLATLLGCWEAYTTRVQYTGNFQSNWNQTPNPIDNFRKWLPWDIVYMLSASWVKVTIWISSQIAINWKRWQINLILY